MNLSKESFFVIIPAGGSGQRFPAAQKKQFLELAGVPVLDRTISVFLSHPGAAQLVVVLPPDELHKFQGPSHDPRLSFAAGGLTRSESVFSGFQALTFCKDRDVVLIHDVVRPLVSKPLIDRIVTRTREKGAVIPAVALTDTVKQVSGDGVIEKTVDRQKLYAAQTPQGFWYGKLKHAYDRLDFKNARYTDESLLMEAIGEPVCIVEGERENIKITTPFDLKMADAMLKTGNI